MNSIVHRESQQVPTRLREGKAERGDRLQVRHYITHRIGCGKHGARFACRKRLGRKSDNGPPVERRIDLHGVKMVPLADGVYTLHKILAGLLDMNQIAGNKQALDVAEKMAGWLDAWSAPKAEEHMQQILNTEFGGIAESLYSLAALTGNDAYARTGDRFQKKRFINPLAGAATNCADCT